MATVRNCFVCGREFRATSVQVRTGIGRYCSRKCSAGARAQRTKSPLHLARRFWTKVDSSGGPDACWPWTASLRSDGYGQMHRPSHGGGARAAHKYAWELSYYESLSRDACVCHRCDNPKCCNPLHLFIGTHLDNSRDMATKGRSVSGERASNHKLSDADCVAIRLRVAQGETRKALAVAYGVDYSTIVRVVLGQRRRNSLTNVELSRLNARSA